MNPGPVVTVAIASLRIAGSPRIAGENLEHVRALAATQDDLPPIIVHRATMRVIDGVHRLRAATLRGRHDIAVRFFDGDEADAFVLAVRANVAHGLPLSLADRKAAARHIVASHPRWSDRLIASVTGLSDKTIAVTRRHGGGKAQPGNRIGRDGRVRPGNIVERRGLAGDLMLDDPNLSLRQVARAAGISPETARAVRARLLAEGPDAPKRDNAGQARRSGRDWPSAVQQLRADPTLRLTDHGRTLLRLLNANAMSDEQWTAVLDNVPPHCRPAIATVAMECARFWRVVAEHLQRNTSSVA